MPLIPGDAAGRRRCCCACVMLVALLIFANIPAAVYAQDAVPAGGAATVANAGNGALLRAEPGYDAAVVAPVAEGALVDIVDGPVPAPDGSAWYQVSAAGVTGYLDAFVLVAEGGAIAAPTVTEPETVSLAATAGSTAVVTSALNLRSGPSTADAVIAVLPAGSSVTITGADSNGFSPVSYNGTTGWAFAAYLSVSGTPAPNPSPSPSPGAGTALTTSSLNLRAGPSTGDAVLLVIPSGATVSLTGESANGFSGVVYNGTTGWAFAAYLTSGGAPSPSPSPGGSGTATVTSSLNLRAGPSTADAVLAVMPAGATVTLTGQNANGFSSVVYNGASGWAFAEFLSSGGAPAPPPSPAPGAGSAIVTSSLNLRAGPSTGDAVLAVMPGGATVTLTGENSNGFSGVVYNGTTGWAFAAYLSTSGAPAPNPNPNPPPNPGGSATTTSSLNLRAGPSTVDAILLVMPAGAAVQTTGAAQNGFYPVIYNGTSGWASGDYLSIGGTPPTDPGTELPPPAGSTGIAWPMRGGTWTVIQGYNNGTHTNRSAFAQYMYSLDFALVGGGTTGQAVYAPVSGTIRWVDRGSGGMLIDAGNGYGVAFFHVTIDGGFGSGQSISQGTYVGVVSGPGASGNNGTPHIDLTCWRFVDGGHVATPFTGVNAISGREFPDIGGTNQHYGVQVNP